VCDAAAHGCAVIDLLKDVNEALDYETSETLVDGRPSATAFEQFEISG